MVLMFLICTADFAEARPVRVSFWGQNTYFHYYMEHPSQAHVHQWKNNAWSPHDWTMLDKSRDADTLLKKMQHANIIYDVVIDEDDEETPVVEVGPGFYKLGGQEKRRMAAYLDHVYGFTSSKQDGVFFLNDARTDDQIGIYSRYGLQLQ